MPMPVRCFTCGKVVGAKERQYMFLIESGKTPADALDSLNMSRYCCRRMFLSHVETIDKLILFSGYRDKASEKKTEEKK